MKSGRLTKEKMEVVSQAKLVGFGTKRCLVVVEGNSNDITTVSYGFWYDNDIFSSYYSEQSVKIQL